MKIVIADGKHEADYIIKLFKNRNNKIIVINSDKDVCTYLSMQNDINTYYGSITKEYDLKSAYIENADLFIALSSEDVKNFVSCTMAKKIFNVKKCIANVINPKNVELYKKLGIDSVICSTYLLGNSIQNEANLENIIKTLSIENDKIMIAEVTILESFDVCNKQLKDLEIPAEASISCIYRGSHIIIPQGKTELLANDKVLVVCASVNKNLVLDYFQIKKKCDKDAKK